MNRLQNENSVGLPLKRSSWTNNNKNVDDKSCIAYEFCRIRFNGAYCSFQKNIVWQHLFSFMLVLLSKYTVTNSYSREFSFLTINEYVDFSTAHKCTPSYAAATLKTYKCKNLYAWNNVYAYFWLSGRRIRVLNSIKFVLKQKKMYFQIPMVNSWCLRCTKYTYLICMYNRERKKNVWNSHFFRDRSTCNALDEFFSRRSFFLSFTSTAVPYDSNKFFWDFSHWIWIVWIIRFPIHLCLSFPFNIWISSEFNWCQEMIVWP